MLSPKPLIPVPACLNMLFACLEAEIQLFSVPQLVQMTPYTNYCITVMS